MSKNFRKPNGKPNSQPPAADGGRVSPNTQSNGGVLRAPEQTPQDFIINNIVMRNVDRTPKDVGRWRTSHMAAESIYFPNRMRLYDLYADVILDAHLSGIIDKRIKTVTNKTIRFVRKGKEDEKFKPLIESNGFADMLYEWMNARMWGITGHEFLPGSFEPEMIPRKHIKPEKGVIAINQTDYGGIPYADLETVMVVGKKRDLGLLLKASFYVLLKKGTFSDWANYIEIFGQPVMVFKYDMYDEKTKTQLTNLMQDIGSSLRISIPKQAEYSIEDGKISNANGDLQNKFKEACNEELSVLILGNTETTKSSASSGYAQSQTQSSQQSEIIKDDIKFVRNLLNSEKFRQVLSMYGYNCDGGEFVIDEEADVNDLKVRSTIDTALKAAGLPIDDDYFYETYNIPKPANYEAMKAEARAEEEPIQAPPGKEPGAAPPPAKDKAKGKKQPAQANTKLTAWQEFRMWAAGFFEFAHKD